MNRKQMRNVLIKQIDDILLDYYKEVDFEAIGREETIPKDTAVCYWQQAEKLIDLMKQLELVNRNEYSLVREVYREYFEIPIGDGGKSAF